jgi:hypothetical protein
MVVLALQPDARHYTTSRVFRQLKLSPDSDLRAGARASIEPQCKFFSGPMSARPLLCFYSFTLTT